MQYSVHRRFVLKAGKRDSKEKNKLMLSIFLESVPEDPPSMVDI